MRSFYKRDFTNSLFIINFQLYGVVVKEDVPHDSDSLKFVESLLIAQKSHFCERPVCAGNIRRVLCIQEGKLGNCFINYSYPY